MTPDEIAQWRGDVLPFAWNEAPPPPNEADLPGGGFALLSADTDRTQSYVFQSARLPEIRGASMRLDDLNRQQLIEILKENGLPTGHILNHQQLVEFLEENGLPTDYIRAPESDERGCLVYVGGGSLLALVPPKLGEKLCDAIERLYPQEAGTATITAVLQPISIGEIRGQQPAAFNPENVASLAAALPADQQARFRAGAETNPIQNLMRRQALRLRHRKDWKTAVPHFETSPYARTCNSCGRRPATDILSGLAGEPPRYLCRVCHQNDQDGRTNKRVWNDRFETWCWQQKGESITAKKAEDLQTIGAVSNRYIGYIHADGNSIGRLLYASDSLMTYSALSQALAAATETAVYEAIYTHLRQGNSTQPFEIITIGGDDVLLIVPADKALPIASTICGEFNARLKTPTMSAGVVLAQESNPIYFLHDLSADLLKSAKRGTQKKETGCLDYMILKSQSTVATNLKDVRNSPYLTVKQEQDQERCRLTGRPYTLEEIDRLLSGAAAIDAIKLSPGQLHQMRVEFQNGRFPGIFYYLYQRARLKGRGSQALQTIEADWGMVEDENGAPPWRALGRAKDGYLEFDTPLLDMLALLDFISPNGQEESDGN